MYRPNPFHGQKIRDNYFDHEVDGPLLAGLPLKN